MVLVLEQAENFANLFRERLQPWMTRDLSTYAGAIGAMFEQVYDLTSDRGFDGDPGFVPGWGQLLDVDSCPTWALPFLGQFVGVLNLQGVADVMARSLIRAQVSMHRGTPASMIATAQATLTGTKTVVLNERYLGDPYQVQVITYTAETPSPSQTVAAMTAVKPAGILLTHTVAAGWTIGAAETFFAGGTIATAEGSYSSLLHFESQIAG